MATKRMKYGMAKEQDYSWYGMLNQYVEHKKTFGRNPRSSGGSPEENRLYYWMYNQTRLIKQGHMSKAHMVALVKAGVDIPNKGNWDENYTKKVKEFRKANTKNTLNKKLYTWMLIQVRQYNNGTLEQWKIDIWDDVYDIETLESFGEANEKWLEMHKLCAANMPLTKDSDKALVKWFNSQIDYLEQGKLSPWQARYMTQSGFALKKVQRQTKRESAWESQLAEYKNFLEENRRLPNQNLESERRLYFWGRTQVRAIRNGQRTQDQIDILAGLNLCA